MDIDQEQFSSEKFFVLSVDVFVLSATDYHDTAAALHPDPDSHFPHGKFEKAQMCVRTLLLCQKQN